MNGKPTSEQLGEAVAQMLRRGRKRPLAEAPQPDALEAPKRSPWTIAVSREAGANGHLIARAVGARLGWPVLDRELVVKIADEMGLRTALLESIDEKRGSWLQECLAGFSAAPGVDASGYVHRLIQTLMGLAAKGECVILGRGAAQVLPPETTLRVRLVGPTDERVRVIGERFHVAPDEARRKLAQTDRDRSRFVWDHFNKDPTDPHGYDLILNSARLGVEACADLVVETLHRMQGAPAPQPARQEESVGTP